MTSRYDTYGVGEASLDEVAARLEELLGLPLQERDSSFYAGTYHLYAPVYGRRLRVYANHDSDAGTWVRPQYQDWPVIVEVSDLEGMDGIRSTLLDGFPTATLLASREVPDQPGQP